MNGAFSYQSLFLQIVAWFFLAPERINTGKYEYYNTGTLRPRLAPRKVKSREVSQGRLSRGGRRKQRAGNQVRQHHASGQQCSETALARWSPQEVWSRTRWKRFVKQRWNKRLHKDWEDKLWQMVLEFSYRSLLADSSSRNYVYDVTDNQLKSPNHFKQSIQILRLSCIAKVKKR